jgi:hypothetical protein
VIVSAKMKFSPPTKKKKKILLVKTRLHSRMEDEFLTDHLLVYIKKEIAKDFTTIMIMDDFLFFIFQKKIYF